MQYFIFIFYLVFFFFVFRTYQVQKDTGFSLNVIYGIFLLKVLAGVMNLYYHNNASLVNDSYIYYWQSIGELNHAHLNPGAFLREWLFNWGSPNGRYNLLNKDNMVFFNHLGTLFLMKFMTLSNLLSGGYQYVNVIFYNLLSFIGLIGIYKTLYAIQSEKKWVFFLLTFFMPTILFWCSGINKDGLMVFSIGYLIRVTYLYLHGAERRYLIAIVVGCVLAFVMRYFYFLCLFPPYLLWVFSYKKRNTLPLFLIVYGVILLLFFNLKSITSHADPMQMIAKRRVEFIKLNGASDMRMPALENSFSGYIKNIPNAISHLFFEPRLFSNKSIKFKIAAFLNYVELGIILFFAFQFKARNWQNSLFLCLLFFAVSAYLFIGFTIPNHGAIARYKSGFSVLLYGALACLSEYKWLLKRLPK
ncbi:MAG TPA: hypothetical protein PLU10_05435 [Chitinophagaceae bacterium]|nr:hypothetical protein [Chitinophagaceae bacterium]